MGEFLRLSRTSQHASALPRRLRAHAVRHSRARHLQQHVLRLRERLHLRTPLPHAAPHVAQRPCGGQGVLHALWQAQERWHLLPAPFMLPHGDRGALQLRLLTQPGCIPRMRVCWHEDVCAHLQCALQHARFSVQSCPMCSRHASEGSLLSSCDHRCCSRHRRRVAKLHDCRLVTTAHSLPALSCGIMQAFPGAGACRSTSPCWQLRTSSQRCVALGPSCRACGLALSMR